MSEEQVEGDVLVEQEEMDVQEDDPCVGSSEERTNLQSTTRVDSESTTETFPELDPTSDTDTSTLVGDDDDRLLDSPVGQFSDEQRDDSSSDSDSEEGLVKAEADAPTSTEQRIPSGRHMLPHETENCDHPNDEIKKLHELSILYPCAATRQRFHNHPPYIKLSKTYDLTTITYRCGV